MTSSDNNGQGTSSAREVAGVVDGNEFISAVKSNSKDIVLLDVRSHEEFQQGVIPGALTIPADEVSERLAEIPTGKQIFIYCKSGVRAEMVHLLLQEKGIPSKFLNQNVSIAADGSFQVEETSGRQE